MEAAIFNNIGACCRKEMNSKMEVEYSTMVISRSQYIFDSNVVAKAFLRRGMAHEEMEKYGKAREDMFSVKLI